MIALTSANRMAVALALAVLIGAPASTAVLSAQDTPQAATEQNMMAMRKNMMAMRQKMMADAEAADARLQTLVDQMTMATGEARIDAMGAVLTELVAQHRAAQQRMGQMMMPGMMQMMGMMEDMGANMQKMMAGRGQPSDPPR